MAGQDEGERLRRLNSESVHQNKFTSGSLADSSSRFPFFPSKEATELLNLSSLQLLKSFQSLSSFLCSPSVFLETLPLHLQLRQKAVCLLPDTTSHLPVPPRDFSPAPDRTIQKMFSLILFPEHKNPSFNQFLSPFIPVALSLFFRLPSREPEIN